MELGTVTRKPVSDCSDRELLEEIATRGRQAEETIEALTQQPMIAALLEGQSPMQAMMAR